MTWITKKDELIMAINELSEQLGRLRSLVDHLPEDNTVKKLCNNCDHLSDISHELDPLGEWKWCEQCEKNVLEDSRDGKNGLENRLNRGGFFDENTI